MEIQFKYSQDLPALLHDHKFTLAVSTYQAGKVALIGATDQALTVSMHQFDSPMGIACNDQTLAVAASEMIWLLNNQTGLPRLDAPGHSYDASFLARQGMITGEIQAHEIQWVRDELWIVNTRFSCLCTLHPHFSFVPRWKPPFISELASEDRCHLNGLAVDQTGPRYVTALGETNTFEGWRQNKVSGGCIIDVRSGEILLRGLAMPHSPRVHRDHFLNSEHLWFLDSGTGRICILRPGSGTAETVARFPGFTRGLSFHQNLAFVGLSKIRETSTFGGMPIAEKPRELKCGIGIVDLTSGELAGTFEFINGVEEIFDVHVLPGIRTADLLGPYGRQEDRKPIWIVPEDHRLS